MGRRIDKRLTLAHDSRRVIFVDPRVVDLATTRRLDDIDVVVRPKQQFKLLAKAWLKMSGLSEDQLDEFDFVVPPEPKTWRSGPIDIRDEIGDTGLYDGTGFQIVRKSQA